MKRAEVLAAKRSSLTRSQAGHTSAAMALEVYAKSMARKRDTGEKVDALIRGAEWAQAGTNGSDPEILSPSLETKTPLERGF